MWKRIWGRRHCEGQAAWGADTARDKQRGAQVLRETNTAGTKNDSGQVTLARICIGSSGLDLADHRVPLTRGTLSDETGLVEGVAFKQL